MAKYRVGVIGLRMGEKWARAAFENQDTELAAVYDRDLERCRKIADELKTKMAGSEKEFFESAADISIVATPDHFHLEHSMKALEKGSNVICEKPLASTVKECVDIIKAARKSGKFYMVGQLCRYYPGFITAWNLVREGAIGELAFIESEYAHDYARVPGVDNWRKDFSIKREGFIGGGCHALDLVRWFAGDPEEVFCYTNRKLLDGWPTDDTGVAICRLPEGVIGKVFVSIGAKRQYTMRTVIYGKNGTIICDNSSSEIMLYREDMRLKTGTNNFWRIPVNNQGKNVGGELAEFADCLERGENPPTDAIEGAKTVAFGEAALESAKSGRPVRMESIFSGIVEA